MRILYFADIRFPLERANGIQTMETCHALAERGHTVHLVVKPDTHSPARDPFEFYGLPAARALVIERANAPKGAGILARVGYMSFVFGRAFGKARADAIITRDLGVAAALLKMPASMRAPVVYESHGYAPNVAAALPHLVATATPASAAKLKRLAVREEAVWRSADGYVTITGALANELERRFGPRHKLAVVPDGMRPPTAPAAPPLDGSAPVAGYAGHLYAWKGVDLLLQAIAAVPDVRGLIVGGHSAEPDLARVKTLAETLQITERVTFTGLVAPSAVPAHLAHATMLVLPNPASAISTHFTSPLKLFEYMAAGRPIIASDLPAIREVLRDGENALLVEAGRADAIARAIRTLAGDPQLAGRLARTAATDATAYTWSRRAERLESLLKEVVPAA
ncbi:MAG: glycosyltransferase family 4 protein [Acidobacteria bacterium]|nr:glycosyltransferase family 4 protein [Acidobacteriota bacterium]